MTFVIWGLYNGLFLILERLFLGDLLARVPKLITHLYAILVVLIGWVFFRADSLSQAFEYLSVMFGLSNLDKESICQAQLLNYIALVVGCIIVFLKLKTFNSSNTQEAVTHNYSYFVNFVLIFVSVLVLYFGAQNPFIYFNF